MPELPEVEVTRQELEPLLVGREIARVLTTAPSYFFLTPPKRLAARLRGRTVLELSRRGKYLLGRLDDGSLLLLHLGMTGQLFSAQARSPRLLVSTGKAALAPEAQGPSFTPDAHTHLCFQFADGGPEVYFRDARKFGKVELLRQGQKSKRLDKLGVDALSATGALLHEACKKRRVAVKTVLLDQAVLAGVGNIYADEALFLTGIRPSRRAHKLSAQACGALVAAVQRVLLRSIETGGSSISDYVRPDGSDGGYQDERRVYGREREPCSTCGTEIRRVVLGARSSFYCPKCQR
jgi:formamidopyrimidine-DNA glycosylase